MGNKIALITGANSGLGLVTAKALAADGFDLILLVRSKSKANETIASILKIYPSTKIDTEVVDLEDINVVKVVAQNIAKRYKVLDRLINNAGYSPNNIEFNIGGYEKSFIANHLGHFALTMGLLDLLKASKEARIINVSSAAYSLGKFERFFQKYNTKLSLINAYGDGKLANILFTKGLKKHLEGATVLSFSLHPGVVGTNFGSNYTGFFSWLIKAAKPFLLSPENGAKTSIYLATTPLENVKNYNGLYFDKSKVKATKHVDITDKNIDTLWDKSNELIQ